MIENNKFFLITGNSVDLFGKSLIENNKKHKLLGIFKYDVIRTEKRIVNDSLFIKDENELVIGFQNQSSYMSEVKYPLFKRVVGFGTNNEFEGIHYKNFYGTYLIGPLLVRNPNFFKEFFKQLILLKDPNYKFKEFDLNLETKAYDEFVSLHYNKYKKSASN